LTNVLRLTRMLGGCCSCPPCGWCFCRHCSSKCCCSSSNSRHITISELSKKRLVSFTSVHVSSLWCKHHRRKHICSPIQVCCHH
ncbi:hypothetical protein V8C86DRAFT_2524394, partial [Haematococcus lacustris]